MNMRKSSHEQVAQQERARERKARTAAAVAGAAASDGEASTQTQVAIGDKTRARSADTTLFNVHSRLEPVQGMARGSGNEDDKETGDMNEDAEDMPVDEVKFHTSGREDSESSERDLTDGVLGVNRGGHTSYEEREDTNADMSESLTSSQLAHELDLLYGDNHDESLHNYDEISFSPNSPSQEAVTTKKRTSDDRPEYETTTVDSQAKRNKLSDPSEHEMKIQGQISEQHAVEAIATKGRKKGQNEELLGDANVLITNSNIETHTSKHKDSVDSAKQSHPTSTKEAEPEKKTMKAKSVDNDEDEFENDGNKKEEEDAQNSKTAFGPLDFETMPGTPIQPFDIEALGEDYEKLTSEYDGKIRSK